MRKANGMVAEIRPPFSTGHFLQQGGATVLPRRNTFGRP